MSHYQWSRKNSSRKRRRRRSVKSNSSFGHGLPEDENEILQMYREDGELAEDTEGLDVEETLVDRIRDQKDIMENVKFQPWPIGKKLQVFGLARSFVVKHEGRLSAGRGYQQKGQQLLKQLKRSWNNLEYWITPWEMRIKRIESHFGSVVTSYFIFLRWLLWINLWLTVVQCCFVIVPEMLVGPDYGTTKRKTIPDEEMASAYDLKTIWNAEGVMRYSPLFYGYYGNADIIGNGYRLPLAYLMTTLVSFAYSFIVVLKKMASNSRQSRMSNKDEQFTFSWKLYTDWDYMVGNAETATTKHASIVTTMKEAIVEEQEKKQEGNKYLLASLRVLSNVMILMLLALSTYIIQLFVERSRKLEVKKLENKDLQAGFWAENELTIIMTMISTLFPNVLDLISLMEKYHPRISLRLQLARIFILNLINLYTLFIALYNKQNDLKAKTSKVGGLIITDTSLCSNTSNIIDMSTPSTIITTVTISTTMATVTSPTTTTNSGQDTPVNVTSAICMTNATTGPVDFCWETMIGQEVFKLTIMDLIFTLGQIFIIDVFRSIFVKYCNNICCWDLQKKFPEYPDFKTAENLLHLINNQGVVWLGVFFSPGLALLNILKLLLLMYFRCWTVIVCNVPQERIFRASRSNNFYFALLLVMLFLCMLPPLFAIVGIQPSPACGPFSGLDKIFHVLTRTMENELPASVNSVLQYVASPGVIVPIFMLMGMTIYYLVSIGRSLRDANNELRMQLQYERTEGRKKVYAMADAKHEIEQPNGPNSAGLSKMASAVTSVLKATQMAKAFSGLRGEQKHKQTNGSRNGQKAPAVKPKPHLPVAVVHGKRSLKRSAAAVMNKRMAVRQHSRQQQQRYADRERVSGNTNGRMMVTASSSLDTPDVSSNEEEDVFSSSHSSSRSSSHQHDDLSAIVDDTGHLRPVTEDNVFVAMDSDSEDDEDDIDDDIHVQDEDDADLSGPSVTTDPNVTTKQQHDVQNPTVHSKPSRPSRKIRPTEIPKITVVDFGEEEMGNGYNNDDDSVEMHMEPTVIVENEEANTRQKRDKRVIVRTEGKHSQHRGKTKQKTSKTAKTKQQSEVSEVNGEDIQDDTVHTRTRFNDASGTKDSDEPHESKPKRKRGPKTNAKGDKHYDGATPETQNTQGKSSKTRFSSILARFQKMDESG